MAFDLAKGSLSWQGIRFVGLWWDAEGNVSSEISSPMTRDEIGP